jgi:hypothetical protein
MKKCHWCGVENETVQDVLYETDPLCDECFSVHYPLPDDYEETMEIIKSWANSKS